MGRALSARSRDQTLGSADPRPAPAPRLRPGIFPRPVAAWSRLSQRHRREPGCLPDGTLSQAPAKHPPGAGLRASGTLGLVSPEVPLPQQGGRARSCWQNSELTTNQAIAERKGYSKL